MLLVPSIAKVFLGQRLTLDFTNKMTPKEAERIYGKKNMKLMQKYLEGITICINPKTKEVDIPESDLRRAYDLLTKGKSNIMWD